MDIILGIIILILAIGLYFLPSNVAAERNNPQLLAIFLFNLFLGWTFFCWVLALVWACSNVQEK